MKTRHIIIGVVVLLFAILLAACASGQPGATAEPCPTAAPCPDCPDCPACPECPAPPEPAVEVIPFEEEWVNSPHNDTEAEAFNHWNEDDPAEVPTSCAQCHSTPGYLDFLGADGSAEGVVDAAAPIGTTIQCVACHNEKTPVLTAVTFPSGVIVSNIGDASRCMVCHQGRASKVQVDEAIEANGLSEDVDAVSEELGFINIHYYAAAATLYGTQVMGGYEYDGKSYDFKNDHVAGYDTCIGCHNSHTLEVKVEQCAACHQGVASVDDVKNIRMVGSLVDYDGDGDMTEGIAAEIDGLREMLKTAIRAYGTEVSGVPIGYSSAAYPYFFIDGDENGEITDDEAVYDNSYNAWTARLAKASYNFQLSAKDPGQYVHGGKYIIQLLYDSIEDLNQALTTPVDLTTANRIDHGHFAGSEEAFRHWDEDGMVQASCAKCHSADGLPTFLKEGVSISQPLANGLKCSTCHDDLATGTRYVVDAVTFPSGATLTFGEGNDSNLCINCHQGRESTVSLDAALNRAGVGDDETSEALRFRNPHYFAAGATLFGTEAKGAYEYEGNEYNGRNIHVPGFDTCLGCHDAHALEIKTENCASCHPAITEGGAEAIRVVEGDFDGDGDAAEGIAGELETVAEKLYAAVQAYATNAETPIVFDAGAYPYFFNDTNADGVADADETVSDNAFVSWTPRLVRAAYNYMWYLKDPGAFAHNSQYMLQVLYDSLDDIGGDTAGMTRPAVKVSE